MTTNLPVNTADLIGALTAAVSRGQVDQTMGSYLKLSKGGFWVYGSDDIEVEDNALWAVDPRSFSTGYVAWGASEILGEEMASIHADPIALANLPDVGKSWTAQVSMQMVCINGEDKGTAVVYKNSSQGGRQRFNEFLQQVLIQYSANVGTDKIVPVVSLGEDSYKHKEYGKIHKPIFLIKQWLTMDDGFEVVEEEAAEEPAPEPAKPARKAKKAAAEEPAADDEPAATPRRRRKRSAA